jgi:hypothetical protein
MDLNLNTKYDDLAGEEANSGKKAGVDKTHSKDPSANVGTGPAPAIADGGVEGEEKQPKERTGQDTDMGGATGGTAKLPDVSEGNNNTGSAG